MEDILCSPVLLTPRTLILETSNDFFFFHDERNKDELYLLLSLTASGHLFLESKKGFGQFPLKVC